MVKKNGYKSNDLLYYKVPEKSLTDELVLISLDHNVLQMVGRHLGHQMVVLYLLSFGEHTKDIKVVWDADEERERRQLGVNDPFWNDIISSDEELFDGEIFRGSSSSKQGSGTMANDEE